mmetsp:Transcript_31262/g.73690  ORF Transcript_31262/g.73690 Transcript_31262/m.73690 type:complete len:219 (-) Transcript_31262:334-990(-)
MDRGAQRTYPLTANVASPSSPPSFACASTLCESTRGWFCHEGRSVILVLARKRSMALASSKLSEKAFTSLPTACPSAVSHFLSAWFFWLVFLAFKPWTTTKTAVGSPYSLPACTICADMASWSSDSCTTSPSMSDTIIKSRNASRSLGLSKAVTRCPLFPSCAVSGPFAELSDISSSGWERTDRFTGARAALFVAARRVTKRGGGVFPAIPLRAFIIC